MKLAILLTITFLTFNLSAATSTLGALTKVLPAGTYYGEQDDFTPCTVELKLINGIFKSFAAVSVSDSSTVVTKEVEEGSDFFVGRMGRQSFLFFQDQKFVNSKDESIYNESFIGIKTANEGKILVTLENRFVNNTENSVSALSCIIKTK